MRPMAVVLAAYIWHWWIGLVLFVSAVGAVIAMVAGYLAKVQAPRYPGRRR